MAWDDTQTGTDSISYAEWNNMVAYIKSVITSSDVCDPSTLKINGVDVTASAAELNYCDGVTSNIQTQLDGKASTSHSHAVNDLSDVTITSVAGDEILAYNSGTSEWVNQTAAEAGLATASDLTSHTGNTSNPHSVDSADVGLGNVENTALSTWAGTSNVTTLGTVSTGVWQGTAIGSTYISDASTWNGKMSNLSDDSTPQLGGDLDLNQHSVELDPTPTSDHAYNGIVITGTAGENVVLGDVCRLNSSGEFVKADSSASSTCEGMLAIATTSISSGSTGHFLIKGFLRDDTWAWTVGGELYVHTTPGNPTQTQPSTTGEIVRIVGHAYSADVAYFNPDNTYVELS